MKEYEVRRLIADVLKLSMDEVLKIKNNESLRNYSLNSLNSIELVVKIEEEMGIEIDDTDMLFENWDTIDRIVKLTNRYI